MNYDLKIAAGIPGSSKFFIIQINMELINLGPFRNYQLYLKIEKLIKN